jgi:predicted transcriptional regulator
MIFEPSLRDLSDRDKDFLHIMAKEDAAVTTSFLADRLHVSNAYLQQYRNRLIAAGLIYAPKRGYLDFAMTHLKDFLRSEYDE